jgi:hypothetical protein
MSQNSKDRTILRDLAKKVAEIASQPIMEQRREMWKRHNRLERVRPMILVFPEGAWRELVPDSKLQCEQKEVRQMEWHLRSRIFCAEHIHDDTVIEKEWVVKKDVTYTGWGLEVKHVDSSMTLGAWAFDPVIKTAQDLKKLRFPDVIYNEEATKRNLELARDLFGDIFDVELKGIDHVSFHLMSLYCQLRGLGQVMLDMYEQPNMLHDAMSFLEEGNRRIVQQYIGMNLLSLNNDGAYHSSGGVGYSTELPKPDYDPERIRPCDMWASAEAQEMAQVSPEMHARFALDYEKRLLEPFGLNGYGCCEDLTHKLDYVFTIPNIRRISISPFADVEKCAQKLKADYIFSWKPHPAYLIGEFDTEAVRAYIKKTLDVTKGCVIEMILKDTHTCENHPERFTQWTDIAQDLVAEYAA